MDPTVLAFSAAVAALTGILFGLTPALQAARVDVVGHLKESGARGTAGRQQQRLRSWARHSLKSRIHLRDATRMPSSRCFE